MSRINPREWRKVAGSLEHKLGGARGVREKAGDRYRTDGEVTQVLHLCNENHLTVESEVLIIKKTILVLSRFLLRRVPLS